MAENTETQMTEEEQQQDPQQEEQQQRMDKDLPNDPPATGTGAPTPTDEEKQSAADKPADRAIYSDEARKAQDEAEENARALAERPRGQQ